MKTSLGIWAFGSMVDALRARRLQAGAGASEPTADKVRRAVEGLGDLIDGYEFHYPQELSRRQPRRRPRRARRARHLLRRERHAPRPALRPRRALARPTTASRDEALRRTLEGDRLRRASVGAHFIIWPGIEGYNYPFQTPYAESWARFIDGVGAGGAAGEGARRHVFLEHKNSEPAMKILMRNIGMTLHVIHTLRGARASTTSRSTWTGST